MSNVLIYKAFDLCVPPTLAYWDVFDIPRLFRDTREIRLPKFLHWIPMITRLPNPEGKGEISMLDLLVNSLRMRPDRIVVREIRRKREAEVLFEAIHTGHSVYATVHANDTRETITRLTNPPIEIPSTMLPDNLMKFVKKKAFCLKFNNFGYF